MAHMGQELRFGAVGMTGREICLGKLLGHLRQLGPLTLQLGLALLQIEQVIRELQAAVLDQLQRPDLAGDRALQDRVYYRRGNDDEDRGAQQPQADTLRAGHDLGSVEIGDRQQRPALDADGRRQLLGPGRQQAAREDGRCRRNVGERPDPGHLADRLPGLGRAGIGAAARHDLTGRRQQGRAEPIGLADIVVERAEEQRIYDRRDDAAKLAAGIGDRKADGQGPVTDAVQDRLAGEEAPSWLR